MTLTLCDVGPRDGLQNEATTLEPATRAELVNRLAAAEVAIDELIEMTSPSLPGKSQAKFGNENGNTVLH